jgi:peptidase E
MRRQIVAMGGGGFLMEPENPLLDDFILGLARRSPARICLLPTASADSPTVLLRFYRAFSGRGCAASDLTTFDSPLAPRRPKLTRDIPDFILGQDVIYVAGGSTVNMLAIWRAHGIDRVLKAAYHDGVVLAGVSAGMICWFDAGLTDAFGGAEPFEGGLGLVSGSACPHYDGEALRRPNFHRSVVAGTLPPGYAADDGAALHFVDERLLEVVASRPNAAAYRVERSGEQAHEERLPARFLGRPEAR